jgi:hypothetical protein
MVQHTHDAVDDVVDIGEVAGHLALAIDLDRLALQHLLGEAVIGHVRPAPRAIDGEEPQARLREAVELGVADGSAARRTRLVAAYSDTGLSAGSVSLKPSPFSGRSP